MESHGYKSYRYGGVGEYDCNDLIAASAETAGAFVHGPSYEVTNTNSSVAERDTGEDAEEGIAYAADHGRATAEKHSAHEGLMRIDGRVRLCLCSTSGAGKTASNAVVLAGETTLTEGAGIRW